MPQQASPSQRPWIEMRGLYGGVPTEIFDSGKNLSDYGINAVFIGSAGVNADAVKRIRSQGARLFAEFNTMHVADFLKEHPDAAPVGDDGKISPAPEGWQGICPTHVEYRRSRMEAFETLLRENAVDGVWLDYHHGHANWERAEPLMPDTCFCDRCLAQFQKDTGTRLPDRPTAELARMLLTELNEKWVQWRCDVFTDWVREFRSILDRTRPTALLGTFHCPWSDTDFDGALTKKLAIDLRAQARYIDVFSPMPYHARFGHARDPEWISLRVQWLGRYLGIEGKQGERHRIWPILQASDWGEPVPAEQIAEVLEQGTRPPATGVMVFAWSSLRNQPAKIEELGRFYRAIRTDPAAGKVQTVSGLLDPRSVGWTLTHEHVLVDFIGADKIMPGRYDPDEAFTAMLPHLQALKAAGVGLLFECTPDYLGRDPVLLRRLSEASGVALVTNTGWYKDPFLPAWAGEAGAEEIAARWTAEARDGIGPERIKPGFIKIATNEGDLSPIQRKITTAAALTARATGLTIASHTTQGKTALQQLEVLAALGVPATQFVWVHADAEPDLELHAQMAAQGAWLSYDGIREVNAAAKLKLVQTALQRWPGQLLISQDAGWYHVTEPQGGKVAPLDWLPRRFVPMLKAAGVSDAVIGQLLTENPTRAFALREPKALANQRR